MVESAFYRIYNVYLYSSLSPRSHHATIVLKHVAQIGAIGAVENFHRAPERKRALIEHSHLLRFGQNVSHFGFDACVAEHQHQC